MRTLVASVLGVVALFGEVAAEDVVEVFVVASVGTSVAFGGEISG